MAGCLAGWLAYWRAGWLTGLLAGWLTDWLAGYLAGWLAGWLEISYDRPTALDSATALSVTGRDRGPPFWVSVWPRDLAFSRS
jgi:fructose-specific phosphotransferase system IIC component